MCLMLLADRYELGDLIGRGGMADVHAGLDQRLQRDVAIKIMRPGSVAADDLEARFEDEARVAARLHHPNVVSVYDTGVTDDGKPFIVMERLPGTTFGDRMRAGPLDADEVRAVAEDVLAAIGAAHAAGVVHRDIKPGNILMTEDGRAKIADFGIARESDTLLVDPTTTQALTGTPAYLAPERIEGKPATAQSDLWALGVVLYEALAGQKPFDGPTPLAVAVAVRDDDPTPLPELRPGVEPTMAAAVATAMAADPSQRFGTAAEMAAAVRGESVVADPNATVVDGTIADGTVMLPAGPAAGAAMAAATLPWWQRVPRRTMAYAGGLAAAVLLLVGIGIFAGRGGKDPVVPTQPVSAQVTSTAPTTSSTTIAVSPVQNVDRTPVTRVVRRPGNKKGGKD
jgi:serine/threonine-protein kinase